MQQLPDARAQDRHMADWAEKLVAAHPALGKVVRFKVCYFMCVCDGPGHICSGTGTGTDQGTAQAQAQVEGRISASKLVSD